MPELSPNSLSVSVVILSVKPPQRLIDELNNQTYKNFEIIIASEEGIVNAMNIALEKAKGDIFVRIDDDVHLPERWLEELLKPFRANPFLGGATGPTFVPAFLRDSRDSIGFINSHYKNIFVRWLFDDKIFAPAKFLNCGSMSYGSNFQEHIEAREDYEIDHLEGTNWAMKTKLIKDVGGFDPKFDGVAEFFDDDVVYKIKKLGYPIKYNPSAYLFHLLQKTEHYYDRFEGWGRIKNWLRFHWRHSKFHYKKVIWLLLMIGYFLKSKKGAQDV